MKQGFIEFAWKIAGLSPSLAKIVAGVGFRRNSTYLSETGWYNSFQKRIPVDRHGEPIPWYSYPAIRFLEGRVQRNWSVFEYGCGNSTHWWGKRVERVESCEHHAGWYDRVRNSLPDNAHCTLKEETAYAAFVAEFPKTFHVIVIDGIERVECANYCLDALTDDGVIIWDNSDREDYKAGYDYLIEKGFRRLDFSGLGPIVMIPTETAIFYKSNNCLGL